MEGLRMRRRDFMTVLSGALTVPRTLRAQQKAMRAIGYIGSGTSHDVASPFVVALRQGLGETGYVEGQNLAIEYRWVEGKYDRLPVFAADLVGRNVELILAPNDVLAHGAKGATSIIPIVFVTNGDPVADGLVVSLARPGGNLTGVAGMAIELMPKRLELLSELVPQVGAIALLVNPNNAIAERIMRKAAEAAGGKGVQMPILKAGTEGEIDAAFSTLVQLHAGALIIAPDGFLLSRREQLVALASRHAVPAIYPWREAVDGGGLISYGTNRTAVARELGIYAGKILKGAKPADLPVQQPTKFELVINIKTAKVLGLTVPERLLVGADEVIE
jgi:putative tryptophan/tyrosine transport system substrate-binding protein